MKLFRAHKIQWFGDVPFQTVELLKEENGVVTFTTEWPVRELCCLSEYFYAEFYQL